MMLRSMLTYSEFIYSLPERYPAIRRSTLCVSGVQKSLLLHVRLRSASAETDALQNIFHNFLQGGTKPCFLNSNNLTVGPGQRLH